MSIQVFKTPSGGHNHKMAATEGKSKPTEGAQMQGERGVIFKNTVGRWRDRGKNNNILMAAAPETMLF